MSFTRLKQLSSHQGMGRGFFWENSGYRIAHMTVPRTVAGDMRPALAAPASEQAPLQPAHRQSYVADLPATAISCRDELMYQNFGSISNQSRRTAVVSLVVDGGEVVQRRRVACRTAARSMPLDQITRGWLCPSPQTKTDGVGD